MFLQYASKINVLFWAGKMIYVMVSNYSIIQWLSQNLWSCCLEGNMKNESKDEIKGLIFKEMTAFYFSIFQINNFLSFANCKACRIPPG